MEKLSFVAAAAVEITLYALLKNRLTSQEMRSGVLSVLRPKSLWKRIRVLKSTVRSIDYPVEATAHAAQSQRLQKRRLESFRLLQLQTKKYRCRFDLSDREPRCPWDTQKSRFRRSM